MVIFKPDQNGIDYDFQINEQNRKARIVYLGGCICLFMLLLFASGNALLENYNSVAIKLIIAVPVAISTFAAKKAPVSQWAVTLLAASLLGLLIIMLWFNDNKLASSLWFFIAPIMLVSGLGARDGLVISAVLLILLSLVFYQLSSFYPDAFLLRFYCVYLIVTLASFVRERTNLQARRNMEALLRRNLELEQLLPICAWCKQIRDEQGDWQMLEAYMSKNSNVAFSHGICDQCLAKQM